MYRKRFEDLEERLRRLENINKKDTLKRQGLFSHVVLVAILAIGIASAAFYANERKGKETSSRDIVEGKNLMLNLGSGSRHLSGYLNVDKSDMFNPDVVWDLEKTPWPFRKILFLPF